MGVVFLNEVSRVDIDSAGGKGANLGELIRRGFPVPPGFIVTAQVYRNLLDELTVNSHKYSPEHIRQHLESLPLDHALIDDIGGHYRALQADRDHPVMYAVRSSATAEDLGDASFAGQHETWYYVTDANLIPMIRKCWASLWNDAACSYRESQGIDHRDVLMAVVVQEMIQADVSGVTFTADPLSGNEEHIVTEASWGMGAAIVDGRVSPDQYVIDKSTGKLVSHRTSDKRFMVPGSVDAQDAIRLIPVPADKRNLQCLSEDRLKTIVKWAKKSEAHFGGAQDIEWAFRADDFFMLQSRPVTVLGIREADIPEGKYVLFKPMYENFSGPVLPLSQDIFASRFPILRFIYGRGYLDLDHIRPVFPFKITDEQIANYAYLSDDDFTPPLSWWRLARLALLVFVLYLTMGVLVRRVDDMPDDFMESFRDKVDRIMQDPAIDASETLERLFLKTRFFEPVGNMAFMVNISAGRYFILMRVISGLLNRWLPDIEADAPSLLCSGEDGILSTDMGRRIWELARTARKNDAVGRIIMDHKPVDALPLLQASNRAEDFNQQLAEFLQTHGHRTLKEFELNSVRWEEDPAPVIGMVRNYLLAHSDPDLAEKKIREHRKQLENRVLKGLEALPLEKPLRPRWRILRNLCKRAKYLIKLRENSRFYHIMTFYAIRKKVLAMEQTLMARGKLKCLDDIFFLTWDEVQGLEEDHLDWSDIEQTMRDRRMEHIRFGKMVPPRTVGIETSLVAEADTGNALHGQGASPGTCRGIARVIMDPGVDATIRPGEILVAPFTDPAWTPLFLTAHAAVVEIGSYLSHAGTIAREYGMPCVVDVADCTRRIRTGDTIMVDGTNGLVLLDGDGENASD